MQIPALDTRASIRLNVRTAVSTIWYQQRASRRRILRFVNVNECRDKRTKVEVDCSEISPATITTFAPSSFTFSSTSLISFSVGPPR